MPATPALAAIRTCVAVGMVCLPIGAWSQTPVPADTQAWRAANEAVGQFKRGHADVLKWEQDQPPAEAQTPVRGPVLALSGLDEAVRRAWKSHTDLGPVLARLDTDTQTALASGRWEAIAPQWLRRVDGFSELLALTAQVRKDWASAQAARALVQQAGETLEAAESARALGERMVSVGNWSRLQQAPWQIAQRTARIDLQRAQAGSAQAHSRLRKTLGLVGPTQTLDIPPAPDAPLPPDLDETQVQSRAAALHALLPYTQRDTVLQAQGLYRAALAIATAADDIVQLRTGVLDETVLHYNGMLKSTWDVLTEAQNRMQALRAATQARRDLAIARIDLEWVLLGGEPAAFVDLGGADAAPATAGH